MKLSTKLKRLGACNEAVEWSGQFTTPQEAWDACERADWMLWILGRTINCDPWTDGRKPLLACALDCACTVQHLWSDKQKEKIGNAIGVLRAWIKGTATVEQAEQARDDLYTATYATYTATYATYTATYAAYAAYTADATYTATYAAAAAATYTADAARAKSLKDQAIMIRTKHYPHPPQ